MRRELKLATTIFVVVFIIDQIVKFGFANLAWDVDGPYMSLKLAYNYGVAFSMFSFLDENLKYIQLVIVILATLYLLKNRDVFKEYYLPIALLYAGGLSNILDRFTYGAVVDYFYWHYGFEFAIFNFADVIIDLAVVIIIYKQLRQSKKDKEIKS
ncbi:signal peptidase II [Aliarcobacter butzleri]|uniref:Lipoprotein signal peptidase n=1 Tax=Aliarcobacter butzleri TaxID=28197 RepID=A0AAP4PB17_9BACT|nr:signal peptidase II [Aliarcobacter butzleri]KLE07244.1 signal peptidase [Aliarcobacter butzleri L353]MCG3684937.1 signal peptidase II [Aliarcobacter butzleri]MCG3687881.1 signal peptidase II [Aliarcobacter butzleri]MCG3703439.1 signal peptidase II [Aliarcobacter butzleri]MCG3705105.1 signal peptidase II [Aliarcobacter butzleri]